jgi:hypothetical protein
MRLNRYVDDTLFRNHSFRKHMTLEKSIIGLNKRTHTVSIRGENNAEKKKREREKKRETLIEREKH